MTDENLLRAVIKVGKTDVRIKEGGSEEYEKGCKLGNKGSDACSVMMFSVCFICTLSCFICGPLPLGPRQKKMYNSFVLSL